MCIFVCLEERKNVQKNFRKGSKPRKVPLFFGLEVPKALYSPSTLYRAAALDKALAHFTGRQPFKGRHLQMVSDRVDLDTPRKILTSCF